MKIRIAASCLSLLLFASLTFAQDKPASPGAQDKTARPSPPAKASCSLGDGATITVDYSSPRAKGRKIFGGLVPYGEVWRLGANEATTFVASSRSPSEALKFLPAATQCSPFPTRISGNW